MAQPNQPSSEEIKNLFRQIDREIDYHPCPIVEIDPLLLLLRLLAGEPLIWTPAVRLSSDAPIRQWFGDEAE